MHLVTYIAQTKTKYSMQTFRVTIWRGSRRLAVLYKRAATRDAAIRDAAEDWEEQFGTTYKAMHITATQL